jgi:DNA-binding NtrC family response regulator
LKNASDCILVVDGNLDYQRFITIVLENAGFSVIATDCHKNGLAIASSQDVKAIITDVESESGYGAILLQLLNKQKPDIPIAILSCADISSRQAKALGATRVLRKPIDSEALLDAVKSMKATTQYQKTEATHFETDLLK